MSLIQPVKRTSKIGGSRSNVFITAKDVINALRFTTAQKSSDNQHSCRMENEI